MDPVKNILGQEFVLLKQRIVNNGHAPSGIKHMDGKYELFFVPRFNSFSVKYTEGGYGNDSRSFKNKTDAIKVFNKGW